MIAGAVSVAGEVVLLFGSLLILIAAVGVMQFRNVLSRMHALSKASTGGITIVLLGAAILVGDLNEGMSLVFAAILQAATNPVSSTLLTQAAYYAEGVPTEMDAIDDLSAALDARDAAARDDPPARDPQG